MGWLHISYFLSRWAIKALRKPEILQENCRNPAQTRGMLKERCSVETLDVGQWSFLVRGRQDQSCRSPPAQFPLGQPHSICVFVPIYIRAFVYISSVYLWSCVFVARPMVKLGALLSNLTAPHLVPEDQIDLKIAIFQVFWEPIGQPSKHLKGYLGPPSVTKNLHFLKRVSWDVFHFWRGLTTPFLHNRIKND